MAVPDFQTMMLPFLQFAADGLEHSLSDTVEALALVFELSSEERTEMLPSGKQYRFNNRVGWARTHLGKAGLLESTRRGYYRITERGLSVLDSAPQRVDLKLLDQFPEHQAFRTTKTPKPVVQRTDTTNDEQTPEEAIETVYEKIRADLASELIDTILHASPAFFERLVVDLLVKMGYGGTRFDAGQAIGGSGDEGIDGIINEDRLGLDVIYIQAKRWQNTVSRPEIQKFAGALLGKNAKKGIFITTSGFSKGARDYAGLIDSNIVLVSGQLLAELMIDYNVGVSVVDSYEIKRIDSDYFEEA